MKTGYIWHELYGWHDTGTATSGYPSGPPSQPEPHIESPVTKQRLHSLIQVSGLGQVLHPVTPRPADRNELLLVHTSDYLDRLESLSADRGGDAGDFAPFGKGGYEIARLSAGGCIAAIDAVLDGSVDNAYALVRPPGHHAEADRGRGFCLLANVAIAAKHALRTSQVDRVAIIDWDVHHGNGTEQAFYDSPDALTISLHQDRIFSSDSGGASDVGTESGAGFNINVPLPPGSGIGAYDHAFEEVIEPALHAYEPDLILVACGYDASAMDPLGRMILAADDFRSLTRRVLHLARSHGNGKVVFCHEGGYSSAYVPFCGLAAIEELASHRTWVQDPFAESLAALGYRDLQPHQKEAIAEARRHLRLDGMRP